MVTRLLVPDCIELLDQHVAVSVEPDFLELECFSALESALEVLSDSCASGATHRVLQVIDAGFDYTFVLLLSYLEARRSSRVASQV